MGPSGTPAPNPSYDDAYGSFDSSPTLEPTQTPTSPEKESAPTSDPTEAPTTHKIISQTEKKEMRADRPFVLSKEERRSQFLEMIKSFPPPPFLLKQGTSNSESSNEIDPDDDTDTDTNTDTEAEGASHGSRRRRKLMRTQNNFSITKSSSAVCYLKIDRTFLYPIVTHWGQKQRRSKTDKTSYELYRGLLPTKCTSSDRKNCDNFHILINLLYYADESGIIDPGKLVSSGKVFNFGKKALDAMVADSSTGDLYASNRVYDAASVSAFFATGIDLATSVDDTNKTAMFKKSFYSLCDDDPTTRGCSLLTLELNDDIATPPLNIYAYRSQKSPSFSNQLYIDSAIRQLVSVNPQPPIERYYECVKTERLAILSAVGSAKPNAELYAGIITTVVIILVTILYGNQKDAQGKRAIETVEDKAQTQVKIQEMKDHVLFEALYEVANAILVKDSTMTHEDYMQKMLRVEQKIKTLQQFKNGHIRLQFIDRSQGTSSSNSNNSNGGSGSINT